MTHDHDQEQQPEPQGELQPEPQGELQPEPQGELQPAPHGEMQPSPQDNVDALPQGEAQPEAQVEAQPELPKPVRKESAAQAPRSSGRVSAPSAPSADQIATARTAHWHQDGSSLLSLETMREWLTRSGLVLYMPRAQQLGAPAPSLVEATLGTANAAPAIAELDAARNLLARLIAEGVAVPLNLLGATGGTGTDVPDFVVSAGVFSYIFTLRGNKAWKQSPVTSGPVKVSPLALAAYELLAAKVTLSAYDLTTQLGKEVTEAAVLRSLTELWSQMRVIPVPQLDGSATLWELASARFTKQIKAGANAGQPSALSALISLYLGQAIAATEDEIESFLSPLAPRSRVRDVLHALLSARQLETIVIDGKTLLHVSGDLPGFAAASTQQESGDAGADSADGSESDSPSRISKFAGRPGSKIGTGLRAKPAFGGKPAFGRKPAFGGKPAGDRERRPFRRDGDSARPGDNTPRFDKPWQDDRKTRPAAGMNMEGAARADSSEGARPERAGRPAFGAGGRSGGDRPQFGKSRFEGRREGFSGGSNAAGASRPPRREFTPRPGAEGGDAEAPRRTFSKPGTFGRKREGGFGGKPPFGGGGEGRPPRREFGGKPAFGAGGPSRPPRRDEGREGERPSSGGFKRPGSYAPRPGGFASKPSFGPRAGAGAQGEGGGEAPRKVFRKFDAPRGPVSGPRPGGGRPGGAKPFGAKPFSAKPFGSGPARGGAPRGDRPADAGERSFNGDRPARGSFGASGGSDRPRPEGRPSFGGGRPGGFAGKGAGDSAGKKPFAKSGGFSKAGGPFAKFADGKKPFRKPGPGKPPAKRAEGGGGFGPTRRKRPEGNE